MTQEARDANRNDLVAGVDSGSTTTKAILLDPQRKVAAFAILPTGADSRDASRIALAEALAKVGAEPSELAFVVATGYGREIASEARGTVTEITCHARGVHALMGPVRTIIDIGGQDSKAIRINGQGRVQDFAMNDKCAAGTGRFLEVMSRSLGVPLQAMGDRAGTATRDVRVSSMCTVFAESEVVSLVAKGEKVEDILSGIHQAIADRVASLALRVGLELPVAVTGGVAMNSGVVRALETRLETRLSIPEDPQLTGALGAAMIARDRLEEGDG